MIYGKANELDCTFVSSKNESLLSFFYRALNVSGLVQFCLLLNIFHFAIQLIENFGASSPWERFYSTPKPLLRKPNEISPEELEHTLFQMFLETRRPRYCFLYYLKSLVQSTLWALWPFPLVCSSYILH